jgi:long-subunit acyl-CoA synthetase (AMP-forming)
VVIYADTKMEWQIAAQAAFSQNCSVVTIYATLAPEGGNGINQTQATVVICDGKLPANLTAIARTAPRSLSVTMGDVSQDATPSRSSGTAHEAVGHRRPRAPVKPLVVTPRARRHRHHHVHLRRIHRKRPRYGAL